MSETKLRPAPRVSEPKIVTVSPPGLWIVFALILIVRVFAAITSPIQDCDETFNFLEPTHYLNHGYGLETWEFSPEYRIRSWLYITLHALPVYFISLLPGFTVKLFEFYALRVLLALVSAVCETLLFAALARCTNPRIGIIFVIIVVSAPGFFHASVAYLPSSFAMYSVMLAIHDSLHQSRKVATTRAIMWIGIGAVVGWPFVGILAGPFIVEEILECIYGESVYSMITRLLSGGLRAFAVLVLETIVDSLFYGRFTSVPFNIALYNVFAAGDKGPDIFGTEPWHFYVRNLLINFNLWFCLAVLAAPVVIIHHFISMRPASNLVFSRNLVLISPFYLWFVIFSLQPHKEERFMYPAYPLLAINGAVSLHVIILTFSNAGAKIPSVRVHTPIRLAVLTCLVTACVTVGIWRMIGLATAYNAPFNVYSALELAEDTQVGDFVCVGKEWYRFPSSYLLPQNARLKFIQSEFRGLLPGEFKESTDKWYGVIPPTWTIPAGMNDRNQEDPAKYTDLAQCKYLVDFSSSGIQFTSLEPDYIGDQEKWDTVKCEKFMDSSRTGILGRLFWIPNSKFIPKSLQRKWGSYCLLRRRSIQGLDPHNSVTKEGIVKEKDKALAKESQ